MEKHRQALLDIYTAGLEAVHGNEAVYQALMARGLQPEAHIIAIGKAAEAMYWGAKRYLDKGIKSALLISKYEHFSAELLANRRLQLYEAAHPIPAKSSLQAGKALLDYLRALPEREPVLFLISGGASSLCEVLEEGWSLEDLQALTHYLLAHDYDIHAINAIRQRISRIKAGKLWRFVGERPVSCLLMSDVPDNQPTSIGSGLLFPPTETVYPVNLPDVWAKRLPEQPVAPPVPVDFHWEIVASNRLALQAMAGKADCLGYAVTLQTDFLKGDAVQCAQTCVQQLADSEPGILLWGGETTVCLPEQPGRGGRNQHFALAAALAMAEDDLLLLAAGTDGTDGTTVYAGAIVDSQTVEDPAGRYNALQAQTALQRADATSFLERTGALLQTGPTGTNVMDIVIGLKA